MKRKLSGSLADVKALACRNRKIKEAKITIPNVDNNRIFRDWRYDQTQQIMSTITSEIAHRNLLKVSSSDGDYYVSQESVTSTLPWILLYWPLRTNPFYWEHAQKQLKLVAKEDMERWKFICLLKCVCK
jgi:hypothetical protein